MRTRSAKAGAPALGDPGALLAFLALALAIALALASHAFGHVRSVLHRIRRSAAAPSCACADDQRERLKGWRSPHEAAPEMGRRSEAF